MTKMTTMTKLTKMAKMTKMRRWPLGVDYRCDDERQKHADPGRRYSFPLKNKTLEMAARNVAVKMNGTDDARDE